MSWIKIVEADRAGSQLNKAYKRVAGSTGHIDNVLKIHSLRPHTLIGHMTLYKSVLHSTENVLPKWYLESLGVYVSYLNKCNYCVRHHYEGLIKLLDNEERSSSFLESVEKDCLKEIFDGKYLSGFQYARVLTQSPSSLAEVQIGQLRASGFTDGEILEINQVTSYFNYVNRSVLGLGVELESEELGLSPGDDESPSNWQHA